MEKKFLDVSQVYNQHTDEEMIRLSADFFHEMRTRRNVREFSDKPIPREIIENCIRTASTSPSGANQQPWHFVVVEDPEIKHKIRIAAEAEEKEFYTRRAPREWLNALAPLGTNEQKPFLGKTPYLIVIFLQKYGIKENGQKIKHYYISESIGIATGILITALHKAGLATLTYTPSRMSFLDKICSRQKNERPYMVLAVGHPAPDVKIPDLWRKSLDEIVTFL